MNRRSFLKTLGLAGASLACAPAASAAQDPAPAPAPGPGLAPDRDELATLFDLSRCMGCGACVEACREANAGRYPEPAKPFPPMYPASRAKPEDWSDKREVDDRLTPYNWLYVQHFTVQHEGRAVELHMPRRCMHCVNPPCANLCPWGACAREADGAVRIAADLCLGGAKCRDVCPWSIPQRQTGVGLYLDLLPSLAGNGVMAKCDRCAPRMARGELPACIAACPFGVQSIGPRAQIAAQARELAAAMHGHIYGRDENGGTNTLYVSPVPFEVLAAAAPPAPGRPGLMPVADSMADSNRLAAAVFLAPVAGLAAGLRQAWRAWTGQGDARAGAKAARLDASPTRSGPATPPAPRRTAMPAEPLRPAPPATPGPASGPASHAASRSGRWAFALAVAALAVSGMAQMPIFKRYGIADVPGLAWTADYHFTHLMHYAAAAVLLFLLTRAALLRLAERRPLSAAGWLMAGLWAGLILTGLARVVKNLPAWDLGPLPTLVADWTHLGLAMLLGIAALAVRRGRGKDASAKKRA